MRFPVFSLFCVTCSCAIGNVKGTTSSAVPDLLYDCYRSNITTKSMQPSSMPLLIELIRKVELDDENAFNMRILATSMLHSVVFDGIKRFPHAEDDSIMIPYRATGEEFYKYQLVVDYLTSGESSLFPRDSLTTPELCFLHKMISNTVDPWERGDESSTCVFQPSMPFNISFRETLEADDKISACPIKQGVVKTKWGPVSAGHIIAGVASALQQSVATFERIEDAINTNENKNVTIPPTITTNTNNVNNVWVSTIAGDLAGVILKQASTTPEIGRDGFWNDTLLPRLYYLKSTKWDMTEAEILGGIDALAMANYVQNSPDIVSKMRLSQLIDLYYSNRGLGNDEQIKATNRSATLNKLLNDVNLAEQVAGTAKLLQKIGTYNSYLSEDDMGKLASIVAAEFKTVAENITRTYDNIEYINGKTMKAPVEIVVILDGSFDAYAAQQMLFTLSETLQVSRYGSKVGVINGQSGNWIVNITGELFQLFADLQQAENEWPSTLSLSQSLETVIYYYQNKTTAECLEGVARPAARSLLIVAPNTRLIDNDAINSRRAIDTIKNANPEINIILVTSSENNATISGQIAGNFRDNDYVLTPQKDILSFVQHVSSILSDIPANIIRFYCNKSQVRLEDYITPDVNSSYQIRKEYLQKYPITTTFSNSNYGDLIICASSDSAIKELCKEITVNGEISFDSGEVCAPESACNLQFRVFQNDSRILCYENECRYMDQVRLDITWDRSSGSALSSLRTYSILITCIFLLYFNK